MLFLHLLLLFSQSGLLFVGEVVTVLHLEVEPFCADSVSHSTNKLRFIIDNQPILFDMLSFTLIKAINFDGV